jgi:hypothetical protein
MAFNAASDTPLYSADSSHPHYEAIVQGLRDGDPNVWGLFDVVGGAMHAFNQITDRVSWDGSQVLWDGDPVHTVLADQLARVIETGKTAHYTALAKFWEKLAANPSDHSREQAFDWLSAHKFQITLEGDVVGYKGVTGTNKADEYRSTATSRPVGKPSAYRNGKALPVQTYVTQAVGDIISMPRSEVVHDPRQSCERGLHVATRGYASGYGNTLLEVHVNPRDIVSVPTADRGDKVRACRYFVARVLDRNAKHDDEAPVLEDTPTETVWAGDVGYKVR